jgi:hypothetical protein
MSKPKFKPEITRVKLNPEQAVLQCNCIDLGQIGITGKAGKLNVCYLAVGDKRHPTGICRLEAFGTDAVS